MGNDWGFAPNPTRNLRFLDFPARFAAVLISIYIGLLRNPEKLSE